MYSAWNALLEKVGYGDPYVQYVDFIFPKYEGFSLNYIRIRISILWPKVSFELLQDPHLDRQTDTLMDQGLTNSPLHLHL